MAVPACITEAPTSFRAPDYCWSYAFLKPAMSIFFISSIACMTRFDF
jgi:hypothetical protein